MTGAASTSMTRPIPKASWETRSCRAYCSIVGSGSGLKGLLARCRRVPAGGVIRSSMTLVWSGDAAGAARGRSVRGASMHHEQRVASSVAVGDPDVAQGHREEADVAATVTSLTGVYVGTNRRVPYAVRRGQARRCWTSTSGGSSRAPWGIARSRPGRPETGRSAAADVCSAEVDCVRRREMSWMARRLRGTVGAEHDRTRVRAGP